jgi:acyl-CoA dehydrogenase
MRNVRKIPTLGVRSAFVGSFDVIDHEVCAADVVAEGRDAWDAVVGTVTLGKFFLGFGSIGICEHALAEAVEHLSRRMLYGKPAIQMPHIRSMIAQAYARLTAMKLYAYRALDYVHSASADDRRYVLFCAVQKARVSTEGVKVMALLSECIGAKGFESDTYFEMALRDAALIPGLEGSTHINLALTAQFIGRYFDSTSGSIDEPPSLIAEEIQPRENGYLFGARSGAIHSIAFADAFRAYQPFMSITNVRLFSQQLETLRSMLHTPSLKHIDSADLNLSLAMGRCVAIVAYAQLVAENATRVNLPHAMVSAIFQLLIEDFNATALSMASLPAIQALDVKQLILLPQTSCNAWDFVSARVAGIDRQRADG